MDWSLFTDAQLLTEQRLQTDGATALEGLARETDEGCFLGVLSGDSTVTIGERVPTSSHMVGSWLGRPYPAYCSDAGQALLWEASDAEVRTVLAAAAFVRHGPNTPVDVEDFLTRLRDARARGYSIVDEEAEPGLYSLAVPIRDFKGDVAAALQVVGPKKRLEPRRELCAAALVRWGRWLESVAWSLVAAGAGLAGNAFVTGIVPRIEVAGPSRPAASAMALAMRLAIGSIAFRAPRTLRAARIVPSALRTGTASS